jgi:hypothetical protein
MGAVDRIRAKFELLAPVMDERMMRLWAAAEAMVLGRGGHAAVHEATGIRSKRIGAGIRDLQELQQRPPSEAAHLQRGRSGLAASASRTGTPRCFSRWTG